MSTFSITEQSGQLRRLAEDSTLDPRIRLRVRIILFSQRFQSVHEVARAARTCVMTVQKWQNRFALKGVDGLLSDAPRPGRPKKVDADLRQEILNQGRTASTRMLARKLGISRSTVHRVLQSAQTQVRVFKVIAVPALTSGGKRA